MILEHEGQRYEVVREGVPQAGDFYLDGTGPRTGTTPDIDHTLIGMGKDCKEDDEMRSIILRPLPQPTTITRSDFEKKR